jgi:hypothetical protein
MGPCTIMDVYPSDFNERFPDAVPVTRARDDLNISGTSAIPCHCEAGAVDVVATTSCGEASFWPFTRGRPMVLRVRGGGGSYKAASP